MVVSCAPQASKLLLDEDTREESEGKRCRNIGDNVTSRSVSHARVVVAPLDADRCLCASF